MIRTGALWDKLDSKLSPKARKISRIIRWTLIAGANAVSTVVTDDTQLRDHIDGDNVYNNLAGAHSQADGTVYLSNFYEANSSHNFNINTDFIGDIATKISAVINAEAEAAYDRGYEDGFRDGFAAGVASVQSELN